MLRIRNIAVCLLDCCWNIICIVVLAFCATDDFVLQNDDSLIWQEVFLEIVLSLSGGLDVIPLYRISINPELKLSTSLSLNSFGKSKDIT